MNLRDAESVAEMNIDIYIYIFRTEPHCWHHYLIKMHGHDLLTSGTGILTCGRKVWEQDH